MENKHESSVLTTHQTKDAKTKKVVQLDNPKAPEKNTASEKAPAPEKERKA